ncbi:MAG TPA: hypothetical protein PK727_03370, partial [Bacteroidales bacterium]|nr:hypothetical protein [Bacteroidales bacterium]
ISSGKFKFQAADCTKTRLNPEVAGNCSPIAVELQQVKLSLIKAFRSVCQIIISQPQFIRVLSFQTFNTQS